MSQSIPAPPLTKPVSNWAVGVLLSVVFAIGAGYYASAQYEQHTLRIDVVSLKAEIAAERTERSVVGAQVVGLNEQLRRMETKLDRLLEKRGD